MNIFYVVIFIIKWYQNTVTNTFTHYRGGLDIIDNFLETWNSLAMRETVYPKMLQNDPCTKSHISWKFNQNPLVRFP